MRRLVTLLIPAVLLLGSMVTAPGVGGGRQANAQPTGTAEPAGSLSAGDPLLRATLDDGLPAAPSLVRLLRMTLAPGATVPAHTHPGPELNLVESGRLSVTVDGDAILTGAATTGNDVATPAPIAGAVDLTAGDSIAFLPASSFSLRNSGDEPVVLLTAVVLLGGDPRPAGLTWSEGTPTPDALQGVTFQVLGDGSAPVMPSGPATITLERLELDAGEAIPATQGPAMLSVVSGGFDFVVSGGSVQVSRTAAPGPQPEAAPGTEYRLLPGDAAYFPAGNAETPRPDETGPLVLLRLSIQGTDQSLATPTAPVEPGAIEVIAGGAAPDAEATEPVPAPAEATPDATETGAFAEGATVVVNETGVRLRAEPSTEAEIVAELDEGAAFVITGSPEEGDDLLWYPVQGEEDADLVGYIAEDFLTEPEE